MGRRSHSRSGCGARPSRRSCARGFRPHSRQAYMPVTTSGRWRWPACPFAYNGTPTTIPMAVHSRAGRFSLACAERRCRGTPVSGCCASRTFRRWSRASARLCAGNLDLLLTPRETVYPVTDAALAQRLGMHDVSAQG